MNPILDRPALRKEVQEVYYHVQNVLALLENRA
jgi:hypothetical protein